MFGIFKKIRDLIAHQQDLKRQRTQLEEMLDALGDFSVHPQGSVRIGTRIVKGRLTRSDYDLIAYLDGVADEVRAGILYCIRELTDEIYRIGFSIQTLKLKLHYFTRNLRSCIRQMQRFFFKNLDDTHITVAYNTYKMQMIK